MHEQSKIVTSRGTTYAGSYPLVPTLYPAGKPLVIAAIALSTILIVLIQNKTFSTMDAKLQASVLYSCFYLFVLGSLARIIISRPPHKVVVGIATALLVFIALGFTWTLLTTWVQFPGTADRQNTHDFFDPVWLFALTVFFLMKIPAIVSRYASGIRQMQSEVQNSFHR